MKTKFLSSVRDENMGTSVTAKQYTMKMEGVEKNILRKMNHERKTNGHSSCEVILLASDIKHYAHKIVLVSFSEFFRRYFDENPKADHDSKEGVVESKSDDEVVSLKSNDMSDCSDKINDQIHTTIQLPGINAEELDPILEYMYTSTLDLKAENINEILLVACLLQITSVIEFCAEVLLKQPGWRSPLVSPKIISFVKKDSASLQEEAVRLSPTAVTWATNGGRPVSHEVPRRQGGRTLRTEWEDNDESQRAVGRRKRDIQPNDFPNTHRTARKRRNPAYNVASRVGGPTFERNASRVNGSSQHYYIDDKSQYESSLAIDYDDLNRNMPRMLAEEVRSIYQLQESNAAPKSLPRRPVERTSSYEKARGSYPPSRVAKSQFSPYSSQQLERDNTLRSSPTGGSSDRHPGEEMSNSIIPHLTDCNRLWQAACATALGFPMYNSNYANNPLVHPAMRRMAYPPKINLDGLRNEIVCPSRNLSDYNGITVDMLSAQNRYSGSISAIFSPAGTGREFEITKSHTTPSRDERNSATDTPQKLDIEARNGGRKVDLSDERNSLPFRPAFKRFCPNVIHSSHEIVGNFTRVLDSTPRRMNNSGLPAYRLQQVTSSGNGIANGPAFPYNTDGTVGISKSRNSCFSKPTQSDWKPVDSETAYKLRSDEGSSRKREVHVDYHRRKRKLLLGAQDEKAIENNEANIGKARPSLYGTDKKCRSSERKSQCSSEDDIIARECNKHQTDGSDFDSDDSGRPSSV